MDDLLSLVRDSLPPPARDGLQQLLAHVPASVEQQLQQLPPPLPQLLGTPEGLALLLALLAALLVALALLAAATGGPRAKAVRTVVLAGPGNAGKTTIFFSLLGTGGGEGVVASMQENVGTCTLQLGDGRARQRTVRLVDVPGHASMREKLSSALRDALGVVFVVDAVEVTPHRTEAAELLYDILSDPGVQARRIPVLVACNKTDLDLEAHSRDFISKTLERQLDAMRRTKTAGMGKEAAAAKPALATPAGKPFTLDGHARNRITLEEVSSKKEAGLEPIKAFIVSNC